MVSDNLCRPRWSPTVLIIEQIEKHYVNIAIRMVATIKPKNTGNQISSHEATMVWKKSRKLGSFAKHVEHNEIKSTMVAWGAAGVSSASTESTGSKGTTKLKAPAIASEISDSAKGCVSSWSPPNWGRPEDGGRGTKPTQVTFDIHHEKATPCNHGTIQPSISTKYYLTKEQINQSYSVHIYLKSRCCCYYPGFEKCSAHAMGTESWK